MDKRCSRCREIKPIDQFSRDARATDGHQSECLECHRISNKASREAHLDEINERRRAAYAENPELVARYRETNRDEINRRSRVSRAERADEINERRRAGRAENLETRRESDRAYRSAHRDEINERGRIARAEHPEATTERRHKADATEAGVPYVGGINYVTLRIRYGDFCCYCRQLLDFGPMESGFPRGAQATIEHIIPKKLGGAHDWVNTFLACWDCNNRKKQRSADSWMGVLAYADADREEVTRTDERWMRILDAELSHKRCPKCGADKPIDEFPHNEHVRHQLLRPSPLLSARPAHLRLNTILFSSGMGSGITLLYIAGWATTIEELDELIALIYSVPAERVRSPIDWPEELLPGYGQER